jgi:hypothetical protein
MPGFRPTPLTWFLGFLVGLVTFILIPEVHSFIVHSSWAIDDNRLRTLLLTVGVVSVIAPFWWRLAHALGWETARSMSRQLARWVDFPNAYEVNEMPVDTLPGNKTRRPWWVRHLPAWFRRHCPALVKRLVPYSYYSPFAIGVVPKQNGAPIAVSVLRDPLRVELMIIIALREEFQTVIKQLPGDGPQAAMIKLQDEIHSMFLYVPDVWIFYSGGMDPNKFIMNARFTIPAPALGAAALYRLMGLAAKVYTNLQFLLRRDENIVRHWLNNLGKQTALADDFADDPNVNVQQLPPFPPGPFAPPS